MTFFRYARTKGGGMGCFAMFCPVLHCRNALKVRYLLYYTHNMPQAYFVDCDLLQMFATDKRKAHQQTTRHAQTTAKIHVPLCLCFALFVCLSVCLFVSLFLCLSVFPYVPVPFCLNISVNSRLNSYIKR